MNNIFYSISDATKEAKKWYFDNYGHTKGVYYKEAKDCFELTFYSNEGMTQENFICKIIS